MGGGTQNEGHLPAEQVGSALLCLLPHLLLHCLLCLELKCDLTLEDRFFLSHLGNLGLSLSLLLKFELLIGNSLLFLFHRVGFLQNDLFLRHLSL